MLTNTSSTTHHICSYSNFYSKAQRLKQSVEKSKSEASTSSIQPGWFNSQLTEGMNE